MQNTKEFLQSMGPEIKAHLYTNEIINEWAITMKEVCNHKLLSNFIVTKIKIIIFPIPHYIFPLDKGYT